MFLLRRRFRCFSGGCQGTRARRASDSKLQLPVVLWLSRIAVVVLHRDVWPGVCRVLLSGISRRLSVSAVYPLLQNVFVSRTRFFCLSFISLTHSLSLLSSLFSVYVTYFGSMYIMLCMRAIFLFMTRLRFRCCLLHYHVHSNFEPLKNFESNGGSLYLSIFRNI